MTSSFSDGYALLVGVGQTAYAPWSLPATVQDAAVIRRVLVDPELCAFLDDPTHVRLLQNSQATSGALREGLHWLATQAGDDPQATVIVYYSGHGWLAEASGRYYLIPHDTQPLDISGTAFSAAEFTEALRRIRARRLLVVLDCCFAAGMASAKPAQKGERAPEAPSGFASVPVPKGLIADLKQGAGRAVFTSCREHQRSWVRPDGALSLYTYHFLEALQGAGNKPGDGDVRLSNLINHLGQAVPESARQLSAEQTPFFEAAAEDFPVARLRGGKGLPAGGWAEVQGEAQRVILQIIERIKETGSVVGVEADSDAGGFKVEQRVGEVAGKLTGAKLTKPGKPQT